VILIDPPQLPLIKFVVAVGESVPVKSVNEAEFVKELTVLSYLSFAVIVIPNDVPATWSKKGSN